MKIILRNKTEKKHLEKIIDEMKILGTPTIKAFYDESENMYIAINGSHRLMACKHLGLTPELEEVEYSSEEFEDDDKDITSIEIIVDSAPNRVNWGMSEIVEF